MNLSLQPNVLSVAAAVLVMAAGIWMSSISCKRNTRPLTVKLEIMSLIHLGAVCFMMFQTEWGII